MIDSCDCGPNENEKKQEKKEKKEDEKCRVVGDEEEEKSKRVPVRPSCLLAEPVRLFGDRKGRSSSSCWLLSQSWLENCDDDDEPAGRNQPNVGQLHFGHHRHQSTRVVIASPMRRQLISSQQHLHSNQCGKQQTNRRLTTATTTSATLQVNQMEYRRINANQLAKSSSSCKLSNTPTSTTSGASSNNQSTLGAVSRALADTLSSGAKSDQDDFEAGPRKQLVSCSSSSASASSSCASGEEKDDHRDSDSQTALARTASASALNGQPSGQVKPFKRRASRRRRRRRNHRELADSTATLFVASAARGATNSTRNSRASSSSRNEPLGAPNNHHLHRFSFWDSLAQSQRDYDQQQQQQQQPPAALDEQEQQHLNYCDYLINNSNLLAAAGTANKSLLAPPLQWGSSSQQQSWLPSRKSLIKAKGATSGAETREFYGPSEDVQRVGLANLNDNHQQHHRHRHRHHSGRHQQHHRRPEL